MHFKISSCWLAGLLCLFLSPMHLSAGQKPVLVYYMPWYVAKPTQNEWGWHWTMDHFNPDKVNASGEREIASWYYPLIGPYDSSDPAVLEYHVLLMKMAGVEGVIVDWYGNDDYLDYATNNRATLELFKYVRKAGLKLSLCYEDQTVQHMIDGNYLAASNAIAHAQQIMLYLQANYFSDPNYLRWNNQPVLLNFGPQYFKQDSDWQAIFSVLAPGTRPAFFAEDNRLAGGAGAFDWPPMWMSQSPSSGGVLSETALLSYLSQFEQNAANWPGFISSAFPRFHDIYQQASVRNYMGYLGDHDGTILRETLNRAMTNASTFVQIVTWNDFGEGTVVEPTREYGYRDLAIIQDIHRQYSGSDFLYHTNDFTMALRLFHLRRQSAGDPATGGELDQVFKDLIDGDMADADLRLKRLESVLKPVPAALKNDAPPLF